MPDALMVARSAAFAALAPRERWTPSEWAEKAPRILSPEVTSEPGPWKNDRTPYLADIMDAAGTAEEIIVCKAAQVGYSEMTRCLLGYWIDMDPGPCMVVMPDQKSAEEIVQERLLPLLQDTPAVARYVSPRAWDTTKTAIRLQNRMRIFVAWAGSSQSVKSRPIRYLVIEEPDEYPAESGAGGDPISKAMKRITTYADKKLARVLIGGTPTTRSGNIWKRWESCPQKLFMHLLCPHCRKYQRLRWAQVKWPKIEGNHPAQAEKISAQSLAYYECEHCQGHIQDHDKPAMLRRRVWANDDQVVMDDGRVAGLEVKTTRLGFHISALYSPWVTFSALAAEWLLSQDNVQALRDFINQRLAEPFETITSTTDVTVLDEKRNGAPPALIVPEWATRLIATADTQGNSEHDGYFYFGIRAWGTGWRSQLIEAGIVSTKEELGHAVFGRTFEFKRAQVNCQYLLIDSGGPRWQEIYSLAQSDPHHIKPAKGANRRLAWMIEKRPQRDHGIILWEIDSQQAKDQLHSLIHHEDRSLWRLNDRTTDEYIKQMQAEHKVADKQGREAWQEKPGRPANHFWDVEALQVAAAWHEGCGMSAPIIEIAPPPAPTQRRDTVSPSAYLNYGRHKY